MMRGKGHLPVVWGMLVLVTGMSWLLGDHEVMIGGAAWTTALIIGLAMVKVRLVISVFMDVGTAPLTLRLLCDIWIVLLGAAMILMALWPAA